MQKLVVANWKAYLNSTDINKILALITPHIPKDQIVVCPSSPYLYYTMEQLRGTEILLGAQDCSVHGNGAYTGEVSAETLDSFGCRYVIVGHSERRTLYNEDENIIIEKIAQARSYNITPIICIGEDLETRRTGKFIKYIDKQIDGFSANMPTDAIIAYEPIWSIGSGKVPEIEEIIQATQHIAEKIGCRVLYGGSVNINNVDELMGLECLSGVLVGKASTEVSGDNLLLKV